MTVLDLIRARKVIRSDPLSASARLSLPLLLSDGRVYRMSRCHFRIKFFSYPAQACVSINPEV